MTPMSPCYRLTKAPVCDNSTFCQSVFKLEYSVMTSNHKSMYIEKNVFDWKHTFLWSSHVRHSTRKFLPEMFVYCLFSCVFYHSKSQKYMKTSTMRQQLWNWNVIILPPYVFPTHIVTVILEARQKTPLKFKIEIYFENIGTDICTALHWRLSSS